MVDMWSPIHVKRFSHSVTQMQPWDIYQLCISLKKWIYMFQGDGDSCSTPGCDGKKPQESTPDMHKGVQGTEEKRYFSSGTFAERGVPRQYDGLRNFWWWRGICTNRLDLFGPILPTVMCFKGYIYIYILCFTLGVSVLRLMGGLVQVFQKNMLPQTSHPKNQTWKVPLPCSSLARKVWTPGVFDDGTSIFPNQLICNMWLS